MDFKTFILESSQLIQPNFDSVINKFNGYYNDNGYLIDEIYTAYFKKLDLKPFLTIKNSKKTLFISTKDILKMCDFIYTVNNTRDIKGKSSKLYPEVVTALKTK